MAGLRDQQVKEDPRKALLKVGPSSAKTLAGSMPSTAQGQPVPAPAAGIIEAELFDGTILEFPAGTDPQVIQRVAREQTLQRRQASDSANSSPTFDPANMTIEQQRALALAQARRRRAEAEAQTAQNASGPWDRYRAQPTPQEGPWTKYAAAPPPAAPEAPAGPRTLGQRADGFGASLFDGVRQGMAMVAGAPVDLVNNAPRLANLLPGVDGVGPMTDNPIGGRDTIDELLRGFGIVDDYEPQGGLERVANRVGEELGSTAVPVGAAVGKALTMPVQAVNSMAAAPRTLGQSVAASFLQPAAVAPGSLLGREVGYATGGGLGAGLANEWAGDSEGALSDFLGSIAGAGVTSAASGLVGAGRNVLAGATNSPNYADDVASAAVAERVINSSSGLQAQAARLSDAGVSPSRLSTEDLVQALRRPADVEGAVPGYRANIADRTQDPGLATLAYNSDAVSPGAASARRVGNEMAVNETMTGLAPEADPSRFRANLQAGVDTRIGAAQSAQDAAQETFDSLAQLLQPTMRETTARGSSIRSALADAYGAAQDEVSGLYGQIDQAAVPVDIGPLREVFSDIDSTLPLNDRQRFRPSEADIPARLAPATPSDPVPTGILDERGRPIMRPPVAPDSTVPLREITAARSGLTDDVRGQRAAGQNQAARVGSQYVDAIDGYMDEALPESLRGALDEARAARRDVADRFERPGTALESVLARREGGGFALDDSAVPARFAQPDRGRLTDLRAALAEAGTDPRLRDGLADEVRFSVVQNGLLDKPQALGKYMADRQVLLSEFPELRAQLEQAGASRAALAEAERVAADTTKRLTTPGRSAEASYLKNVEDPTAAIRSVIANPNPRQAVADLVTTAASPQARQDLRGALWEEVKRSGKMQADGMTGETRWNGKRLRALFDDPKFAAVADELWKDDPEDLVAIKEVFGALAGAEGSSRARALGSSGTPQSLGGQLDPALTASSIASRARSVSRGQLSPTIAGVDILGTWLRRRSAQVQSRAIDAITASVVNNPGLAADLLAKYNPATAAARRAMLTQKYGVRATTLLNILDEAENDDPLLSAIEDQ